MFSRPLRFTADSLNASPVHFVASPHLKSAPMNLSLGKRKHTPPCSSTELFFAEKNGVHRGKISVVDMVFLVFIGFLYPPPAWKVLESSFRPEKFSKRFSFGGGCVRFFLLCPLILHESLARIQSGELPLPKFVSATWSEHRRVTIVRGHRSHRA